MTEQRRKILQMLAEGKITTDEADQLLAALARQPADSSPPGVTTKAAPKYLRVLVDSPEGTDSAGPGSGPGRVNIRVPLQLLRAGVRLASLVPPQALGRASDELHKAGLPLDLRQLKPEQLEELVEHLGDLTIDVDQPDVQVRLFCE